MKSIFLLAILAFISPALAVDERAPTLFPVDRDNKWGFIDESGKVIIPLQFDGVSSFSEGLARAKGGEELGFNRYGFIDRSGKWAIAPRYRSVWNFSEGLAWVSDNNGPSGFVDRSGKLVLPIHNGYEFFGFRDGLALGRPLAPSGAMLAQGYVPPDPTVGWIDKTGKWAIEPRFGGASSWSEGLAAVTLETSSTTDLEQMLAPKLWGYINRSGEMKIEPRFNSAGAFNDGVAHVAIGEQHFFVDKTGARIWPDNYEDALGFNEKLAAVKRDGKWGFIDRTGKMKLAPQWDEAASFHNGRAVVKRDRKYGVIDETGRVVVPPTYDYIGGFRDTLSTVTLGREPGNGAGRGYINRDGKIVWAPVVR